VNDEQRQAVEQVEAFWTAARAVEDEPTLDHRARLQAFVALAEMADRTALPTFARNAVARVLDAYLHGTPVSSPDPVVARARTLRHRGLVRCPEWLRALPTDEQLDREDSYRAVAFVEALGLEART